MAYESATYIPQLVVTNPTLTDAAVTTVEHVQLIKAVLQNQFPNITNTAVTASAGQLNTMSTLYANSVLTIPSLNNGNGSGSIYLNGDSSVGATATRIISANNILYFQNSNTSLAPVVSTFCTITTGGVVNLTGAAPDITLNGLSLLPIGMITLWAWSLVSLPANWHVCDGSTVNGIGLPDLRDRFVVAAGNSYGLGAEGGYLTQTSTTDTQGSHNHLGVVTSTALSVDMLPSHTHGVNDGGHNHNFSSGGDTIAAGSGGGIGGGGSFGFASPTTAINYTGISIQYTGSGNAHNHGIYTDGAHLHNVNAWDNRPPFVAIYYVMRVA